MRGKKVFVGMSGGVDSSVAVALLVEQGYGVTGVYMKNWSRDLPGMKCPWAEDLADAKRVAVQLGIDFEVWDFEKEYREKVVEYMVEEYRAGRTPNPDIMCNQEVKFGLFYRLAMERGADFIATGHYARVAKSSTSGRNLLMRAVDEKKDQTYFLYRVTGEALRRTLFPIGDYKKSEVREMAKERGLATANRKESMGVCFVGNVGIREFLGDYMEKKAGEIRDVKTDEVVGEHDGAVFYTIGQRHGLGLGGGLPYYVTNKDIEKNIVYVSRDLNERGLWRKEVRLVGAHWINSSADELSGVKLSVRVRHQAPLVGAEVVCDEQGWTVRFDEEQRAMTAGQSVVVYDGEMCLGGGIIG